MILFNGNRLRTGVGNRITDLETSASRLVSAMKSRGAGVTEVDMMAMDYGEGIVKSSCIGDDSVYIWEMKRGAKTQVLDVRIGSRGMSMPQVNPHHCVVYVKSGVVHDAMTGMDLRDGEVVHIYPGDAHSMASFSGAGLTVYNTMDESVARRIVSDMVDGGIREIERVQKFDKLAFHVA